MNRFAALAVTALATGALGFAAVSKPGDPVPYTLGRQVVTTTVQVAGDGSTWTTATVDCPIGKVVVSGGYNPPWVAGVGSPDPSEPYSQGAWIDVKRSYPADADSWALLFTPYSSVVGHSVAVPVYAVCVNP